MRPKTDRRPGEDPVPAGTGPTIDRAALAALCPPGPAGSDGFLNELIDQFIVEIRLAAADLDRASATGDRATLRAIAHRVKGTSMTMGAIRLASLCDAIERGSASSLDPVIGAARIGEVCDECARTIEAFTAEQSAARANAHATALGAPSRAGGRQQ